MFLKSNTPISGEGRLECRVMRREERGRMRGRDFKVYHRRRLIKKRRFHWGHQLSKDKIGFAVNTPTPCSCYMCGNPRKYFGELTIQERKQNEKDSVPDT